MTEMMTGRRAMIGGGALGLGLLGLGAQAASGAPSHAVKPFFNVYDYGAAGDGKTFLATRKTYFIGVHIILPGKSMPIIQEPPRHHKTRETPVFAADGLDAVEDTPGSLIHVLPG